MQPPNGDDVQWAQRWTGRVAEVPPSGRNYLWTVGGGAVISYYS